MERDIAVFADIIGEKATAEIFSGASKARHTAIETILWNSEMEQWLDYWLPTDGKRQVLNKDISLVSYIPIRLRCTFSDDINLMHQLLFQGVYKWESKSQNRNIFASNFVPLWLNAHDSGASCTFPVSCVCFLNPTNRATLEL